MKTMKSRLTCVISLLLLFLIGSLSWMMLHEGCSWEYIGLFWGKLLLLILFAWLATIWVMSGK
jgi:hypothetical protein